MTKARWLIAAIAASLIAIATTAVVMRKREPVAVAPKSVQAQIDPELILPATLQAAATVPVAVPIEGKIESFSVEVGDEVYEGQTLAQIRSETLETHKQEAEVDYESAETRARNLDSALSAARLEASRAIADASRVRNDFERASKNMQRQKMLLAEGATPRLAFEKAEKEATALEAESKNLESVASAADERVSSLQRELDAARKLLEGKADDLEQAKTHVGSGQVLSPANGIVVSRRGQAGDQVHPSMSDLMQIASDLSTMHAVAEPKPEQFKHIKPGQPATVTVAEMAGEVLQGSVTKAEDGKVTVQFANPNPLIKPGLTAQIRIKIT